MRRRGGEGAQNVLLPAASIWFFVFFVFFLSFRVKLGR
jgi:hypothetical protein